MGKKHSIDTIAEVLIDKLTDIERLSSKIESASKKKLNVDITSMKKLFLEHKDIISEQLQNERKVLRSLEQLKEKNNTRLPNWILICLFASYFITFGVMFYLFYTK